MDICSPSQNQRDTAKALHSEENANIARRRGAGSGLDDEADGGDHCSEEDEGAAQLVAVGKPGQEYDHEETEEIWRRGEAVGLLAGVGAHLGDDGGHEEREGSEANVDTEVHDSWDVCCGR